MMRPLVSLSSCKLSIGLYTHTHTWKFLEMPGLLVICLLRHKTDIDSYLEEKQRRAAKHEAKVEALH